MFAHIIAGDVGQARLEMSIGGIEGASPELSVQPILQSPPAPGSAEIEAVQMRDLAVGSIGYEGRREEASRLALPKAGKKGAEPVLKLAPLEYPPHQERFNQYR